MVSRKPDWLKRRVPETDVLVRMKGLLRSLELHTVCESAHCPNQGECFGRGVATFMILGDVCTRHCNFCAVGHGTPPPVDSTEPEHVAEAVRTLGLKYVVITSVTRDDLADGGASQFSRVVREIHELSPDIAVEVLIPDFGSSYEALATVVESHPKVTCHNIETVPSLYPEVRPQADYQRSLDVLKNAKRLDDGIFTKSGIMLGLGETEKEIIQAMRDLRKVDCDFLTLGQYLQPSLAHHEVARFIPPEEFETYRKTAIGLGFKNVASAPLVRSSFFADRMFEGS